MKPCQENGRNCFKTREVGGFQWTPAHLCFCDVCRGRKAETYKPRARFPQTFLRKANENILCQTKGKKKSRPRTQERGDTC